MSRRLPRRLQSAGALIITVGLFGAPSPRAEDAAANDYPTPARVDYVLGCMAANANTREAMMQCSCAIDTIAKLIPYADYEKADTALSLQAGGGVGGRVGLFRDPPEIKAVLERLRQAQAEANLDCFR
jgi:ArsR family metal-binding transcriptional regulator